MNMSRQEAWDIVGGLSRTSKMPWYSWSIPIEHCKVGSKLAKIPGTVCYECYAGKGTYNFPNVVESMAKRYATLRDPRWVDAMSFLLNDLAGNKPRRFRWFDAGDLQNISHLVKIIKVARRTPTIRHWVPTKEKALVLSYKGDLPANLTIRLSAYHIDDKINGNGLPTSAVVTANATCPAYQNDGKCGNCDKCWDANVSLVSYPLH